MSKSGSRIDSDSTKTVLIIVVGFVTIFLLTQWKPSLIIAFSVGILGAMSTTLAQGINYVWMKIGTVLGFIVPNIVMTIIFYFFLTPIALLSKVFGEKNPLNLKNKSVSLFENTGKKYDKDFFEKPW